ncbi:MAG: N-acetyl sugar amidotransferase [candidate division Zixibacteria bacterium]|nr:N-acetyl sugar amidotransferase [candidate division Zixibacteria bacterium]
MQVCTTCIYDERIPGISFDENGVCNYCHQAEQLDREYPTGDEGMAYLKNLSQEIKKTSRNKKYDVVVGVSGGCDSSYLLHVTKNILGLRPLAVHFDNTWNSKIAVENLYRVTQKLDIDLYTHVVDNKEYNAIFKSFFKASVPEIDTPADIGLAATHYLAAQKFGIKYIFDGHSFRNEGISPPGWFYMDAKYIQGIFNKFGSGKIKTLPNLWLATWLKWTILNRIKKIRPLYYIKYDKSEVKEFLKKEFDWQWYGGHHMENRTAYFTNNYYLPEKFNIDLRFCEYSANIRSGTMTREEALEQIAQPKPFDTGILEEIKKRLSFTDEEFASIMVQDKKTFMDYQTYKPTFERLRWMFKIMADMDLVPKSFYLKYTRPYSQDDMRYVTNAPQLPFKTEVREEVSAAVT